VCTHRLIIILNLEKLLRFPLSILVFAHLGAVAWVFWHLLLVKRDINFFAFVSPHFSTDLFLVWAALAKIVIRYCFHVW
jgi:hypothetical protein